ncbi:MAG: DEAD/DEAH box helicase [bacterium]|nr:DEAD/DEAH box helicase [bacterium]
MKLYKPPGYLPMKLDKAFGGIYSGGIFAEVGEDYYLFMYRSSFIGQGKYAGLLFMMDKTDPGKPIKLLTAKGTPYPHRSDTHVRAAVYFVEQGKKNTMRLKDESATLYERFQGIIRGRQETIKQDRQVLQEFDFNARNHQIKAEKIKPAVRGKESTPRQAAAERPNVWKDADTDRNPVGIMQRLKILAGDNKKIRQAEERGKQARMGVSLLVPPKNKRIDKLLPVLVPIDTATADSTNSADSTDKCPVVRPVPLLEGENLNYRLKDAPPLLVEFSRHLQQATEALPDTEDLPGNPTLGKDIIHRVYFEKLTDLLPQLPTGTTFYHTRAHKPNYLPMEVITFDGLEVQLAPRDSGEMGFFLTLTGVGTHGVETHGVGTHGVGTHGVETHGVGTHGVETQDAQKKNTLCPGLDYRVVTAGAAYVFFIMEDNAFFAVPAGPGNFLRFLHFLQAGKRFHSDDMGIVTAALERAATPGLLFDKTPMSLYRLELQPIPQLEITEPAKPAAGATAAVRRGQGQGNGENGTSARIDIHFDYQSRIRQYKEENPDVVLTEYERDGEFEARCKALLRDDEALKEVKVRRSLDDGAPDSYFLLKEKDGDTWLREGGKKFLDKGFSLYSKKRKRSVIGGSRLELECRHNMRWLEFSPLVTDQKGKKCAVREMDFSTNTVTDADGNVHLLEQRNMEQLKQLARYAGGDENGYRVPEGNFFLLNHLQKQGFGSIPNAKKHGESARRLENFKDIPRYELTRKFRGTLRNYQMEGYRRLRFWAETNLNGCLADDMGLGKTVQTLALLYTLKNEKVKGTTLLVAPVSAIPNWEAEIKRFSPTLSTYRHVGTTRSLDTEKWRKYHLVLTSFATMRIDIDTFSKFSFHYIVLDESQNIKNHTSQVAQAAKKLKSKHRLALSGTPIENNTMELWALFDFLMPGFLGTHQWFKKEWALPVEKGKDLEKIKILKRMIQPLMLRRKKEEVEKQLPEKIEIVETLRMEQEQYGLYARTATHYRKEIKKEITEKGVGGSSFKILQGMLRLRQICLFPQLADKAHAGIPSAKFDHFIAMLGNILEEGHKVLIFSQFTEVLGILKQYLQDQEITFSYLDGSVHIKKREKAVKDFQQNKDNPVFLLSLKAGGVALNLTAADYVIIFDPWWNPAVEAQAVDRSHRIGQTRKVIVYRLVLKDTIEEKMLVLQERKKELVEKLIAPDAKTLGKLNRDDIMNLFRF